VAKGIGDVAIVAISTGTNNVFPRMIEGTIAGLAAGLIATSDTSRIAAVRRQPRLEVLLDGEPKDMALIDAVTSRHAWIGARAIWDAAHIREIVLSRVAPAEIGMCGLGGLLFPGDVGEGKGVHVRLGDGGRPILAPIAPGLIKSIPIADAKLVSPGELVDLDASPCAVALDGEREFEILKPGHTLQVRLDPNGPNVVDVEAAISAGAAAGAFTPR